MRQRNDIVFEAIRVVGSMKLLGAAMGDGITPQAIWKWKWGEVPAERVLAMERATGISRSRIRPDLYPPGDEEAAQNRVA